MIKARTTFEGEADKAAYVAACEAGYEAALDEAVLRVRDLADCRIVALSGPTCSGKTTTARKLISEFLEVGRSVHVVSIDDFFLDRSVLMERAARAGTPIDFDSPSTIDMAAFSEAVADILAGRPARLPRFDFRAGCRTGVECIPPTDHDVYIFEGIQAIYPEVTAHFEGHRYFAVSTFAARSILVGDQLVDRTTLRLLRRLVRDYNFRGASPIFTLELWEGVRANEEKHIFPHADQVDVCIDSTLGYELSALKPYLLPLLFSIPEEHAFYEQAQELSHLLSRIDEISKTYIPPNSVYREFLG